MLTTVKEQTPRSTDGDTVTIAHPHAATQARNGVGETGHRETILKETGQKETKLEETRQGNQTWRRDIGRLKLGRPDIGRLNLGRPDIGILYQIWGDQKWGY